MAEPSFYGYPGQIWAICFAALKQLSQALSTTSDPFTTLPLAEAVTDTLVNAAAAINANRIAQIWQGEATTMQSISILPIVINPSDAVYFNARLQAMLTAGAALAVLVPIPNLASVAVSLNQGNPAIPDPGMLEFFQSFAFETPPAGLTATNFPSLATQDGTAFADVAAAVSALQGNNLNYFYDLPNRFSQEMSAYAEMLSELLGFATVSMSALWNQMFTLPTMLLHADRLSSAPNNIAAQQDQLLRFLILTALENVYLFMLSVERPVTQQILQATVMTGDSLMDIAARSLGNFEQWVNIATLNKLQSPFIGAATTPGVAGWGSKVLLPSPGNPPPGGVVPSYLVNFLGVDIYFGPINGDMPPWTGDFALISGYDNFRWALGRRMQTTLGTLLYHSDYGCRIPPEVGNVQTNDTAGYITAFGISCLKSDPRVASVLSAQTAILPNFSLGFSAEVLPNGFGATSVTVNEVINSSISPVTAAQG